MLKKMSRNLLYVIVAGVAVPFLLVALGVGGEAFEKVGWIIPFISIWFGGPLFVVLLILDVVLTRVENRRQQNVGEESKDF